MSVAEGSAQRRELAQQDHFNGVFIRRADQNWEMAKALRSSRKSVRDSVEELRGKHALLSRLQQKVLAMYDNASGPVVEGVAGCSLSR